MSLIDLKSLGIPEMRAFFDSFDVIFVDCDGVLWVGANSIQNAPNTINALKTTKSVYFLTNSSMRTTEELLSKFKYLGFDARSDEILGTAKLTAEYLNSLNFNKTAYLVAPKAVKMELDSLGINNKGCGPDVIPANETNTKSYNKFKLDPNVKAVVVGFDLHFSYPKLAKATAYLTASKDVHFIATNPDDHLPRKGGGYEPGCGSYIKAIESSSARKAVIIGKPSRFAFDYVSKKRHLEPHRVLMIGDRCDTDIEFGKNLGMQTLLVLTGVTKLNDVKKHQASGLKSFVPDFYLKSIGDLLEIMESIM